MCFMCSTKSGKCLTCDQSTWGLPSSDECDYFSVSCDAALGQCLLNCEGIVLTRSTMTSLRDIIRTLYSLHHIDEI